MASAQAKKYFYSSFTIHLLVLCILLFEIDWQSTMPVVENTNQHDVISAVVLGDNAKSKILPLAAPPSPSSEKPAPSLPATITKPAVDKDVIALKPPKKIKIKAKKIMLQKNVLANDLLQDIKKQQKQIKTKPQKNKFEKLLKQQSEQSLRQTLLNEDIKLQSVATHASQGVVNKYKALILQAISQQWSVPPGVDPNLHCILLIRLAPNGIVQEVAISKSSGVSELDSSARAAVMKASPLPVPKASNDFAPFRQFELNVRPKDIIE